MHSAYRQEVPAGCYHSPQSMQGPQTAHRDKSVTASTWAQYPRTLRHFHGTSAPWKCQKDLGHSGYGYSRCQRRSETGLGSEPQPRTPSKDDARSTRGRGNTVWETLTSGFLSAWKKLGVGEHQRIDVQCYCLGPCRTARYMPTREKKKWAKSCAKHAIYILHR